MRLSGRPKVGWVLARHVFDTVTVSGDADADADADSLSRFSATVLVAARTRAQPGSDRIG